MDAELRELERRAADGEPEAGLRALATLKRSGREPGPWLTPAWVNEARAFSDLAGLGARGLDLAATAFRLRLMDEIVGAFELAAYPTPDMSIDVDPKAKHEEYRLVRRWARTGSGPGQWQRMRSVSLCRLNTDVEDRHRYGQLFVGSERPTAAAGSVFRVDGGDSAIEVIRSTIFPTELRSGGTLG